jgi:hypothetical protein
MNSEFGEGLNFTTNREDFNQYTHSVTAKKKIMKSKLDLI